MMWLLPFALMPRPWCNVQMCVVRWSSVGNTTYRHCRAPFMRLVMSSMVGLRTPLVDPECAATWELEIRQTRKVRNRYLG